jgi:hypothetical protein
MSNNMLHEFTHGGEHQVHRLRAVISRAVMRCGRNTGLDVVLHVPWSCNKPDTPDHLALLVLAARSGTIGVGDGVEQNDFSCAVSLIYGCHRGGMWYRQNLSSDSMAHVCTWSWLLFVHLCIHDADDMYYVSGPESGALQAGEPLPEDEASNNKHTPAQTGRWSLSGLALLPAGGLTHPGTATGPVVSPPAPPLRNNITN